MAIESSDAGTPGWWLARLLGTLGERREHYDRLESYYDGRNAIPVHADRACSDAYRRLMSVSRTNFAELVVEAVRERMRPVGFRTGAAGDEFGDARAWEIWQANSLDADSNLVHTPSLSMGMAYVIVGPKDPDTGAPVITPEDPREVVVETDPVRRRRVRAGLKAFRDDVLGIEKAYVYLDGGMRTAVRDAPTNRDSPVSADMAGWEWDSDVVPYQGGPPVVPFPNRPKTGHMVTRGEFETHLPVLDRINYTTLQRVEIATLQAFRQRAIKSDELADTDEEGNPIDYDDVFEQSPGALWKLPASAELWESGQVDLGPVRQAIRDDVQDLAAVTRTPLFYLTPEATNGSAEGASLAREGLIFKTFDRITESSEAWEQVMAHAFRFDDDPTRANRQAMEVIWAPPERFSIEAKADAASKATAGGLTWHKIMEEIWGFSPQEIEIMAAERNAEMLRAQAATLTGQVIGGAPAGGERPTG